MQINTLYCVNDSLFEGRFSGNQTLSQAVFYSHHHAVAHRDPHCDEAQGYVDRRDLSRLCRSILSTALMIACLKADFLGIKHCLRQCFTPIIMRLLIEIRTVMRRKGTSIG